MTVREYIVSLTPGITIPDAYLVDMGVNLDQEYDSSMFLTVGQKFCSVLGGIILAPRVKSVNENGFSMSWDTESLGKYYLWLCKRYGVTPDPEVVALLGINAIIDITDTW